MVRVHIYRRSLHVVSTEGRPLHVSNHASLIQETYCPKLMLDQWPRAQIDGLYPG